MKKRLMIYLMVIAITCVLSIIYKDLGEEGIFLLYAPFLVMKDFLASLSLSSGVGNFFAWTILLSIAISPLEVGLLFMKKKHRFIRCDLFNSHKFITWLCPIPHDQYAGHHFMERSYFVFPKWTWYQTDHYIWHIKHMVRLMPSLCCFKNLCYSKRT